MKIELVDTGELGFIVYRERNKKEITLKEVEENTGVQASRLSLFENGKSSSDGKSGLSMRSVKKVLDYLGVKIQIALIT